MRTDHCAGVTRMPDPYVSRPPLAFRVGIVSACTLQPSAVPLLKTALGAALRTVRDGLTGLARHPAARSAYGPAPDGSDRPTLRLISPLYTGAGLIPASQALDLGYALDAPLPFALAQQ